MKNIKQICFISATCWLLSSGVAVAARGHGGHGGGGWGWGLGIGVVTGTVIGAELANPYYPYSYYPYSYYPRPYYSPPYPYYAYPPVAVVPQPPSVYIEHGSSQQAYQQPAPQPGYYWYHCNNPDGYYPYVKECPSGWQKVSPQPPARP